jgi:hypothetical protein
MSLLLLLRTPVATALGWGDAWDDISLQIDWTLQSLVINGGAPYTLEKTVSVRFRGASSASSLQNGLPSEYRIRDSAGSFTAWTPYVSDGRHKSRGHMTVALTLLGNGDRTVEIELRDEDLNTHALTAATIEVVVPGETIGGVAPPLDITNWQLLIGGKNFIDALDAPPSFSHGLHGPGSLRGQILTDQPMRRYANELVAGAVAELYDGPLMLWDGKLKPQTPMSDDDSMVLIDAAGPLDLAKQDETHIEIFVDADPENWHQTQKSYRKYEVSIEDGFRIEHRRKTFADGGKLGSVYYWLYDGRRTDAAAVIDHVYFADSDIDVEASNWYAKFYVAEHPWGTWYEVPAAHNGEWHNETDSGAQRIPSGTDSFADLAADHWPGVAVRAVKGSLKTDADVEVADAANDRWLEVDKPQVFVYGTVNRIDEIHDALATSMGYTTDCSDVGSDLTHAAFQGETSRAAIFEETANLHSSYVEWGWKVGGLYICRPRPAVPEMRSRYYVLKTEDCAWGVVTDQDLKRDIVCVSYRCLDDAALPNGKVKRLYRPAAPVNFYDRVAPLDLTGSKVMTEADAQNAGDQWLAWNSAESGIGPISGFGAWLKTVDGIWVEASHARNGDWIRARDPANLLEVGPYYITGVEVASPDEVTLYVGGAELGFTVTRSLPHRGGRPRGPKQPWPGRGPRPGWGR